MELKKVSFEVAKLFKEKGFNEPVTHKFDSTHINPHIAYPNSIGWEQCVNGMDRPKEWTAAPTLDLVCKWLRDVHNLSIRVGDFYTTAKLRFDVSVQKIGSQDESPFGVYSSYEQAQEAGIIEALKLI